MQIALAFAFWVCPRQQEDFGVLAVAHLRQAGEHIAQIGVGIKPVPPAAFDDGINDGAALFLLSTYPYFGTVHHHCSASAFQSSTDEQNEWNQDGLHITVGQMDAERHDLHARFYLGGNCFEPDLSCFWPLDAELALQVPPNLHHELARYQMGSNVTVDFPDPWRHHLVEAKPESRTLLSERSQDRNWPDELPRLSVPLHIRVGDALEDIHRRCAIESVSEDQWLAELHGLAASDAGYIIVETCMQHGVMPDELLAEASEAMLEYSQ